MCAEKKIVANYYCILYNLFFFLLSIRVIKTKMASRAIERRNSLLRAQGKLPQQSSVHTMQSTPPTSVLYSQNNVYTRNQQLQIQQQQMQEYQRRLAELQKNNLPSTPPVIQTTPPPPVIPVDLKKELQEEIKKLTSDMQAEILKQNNEILKLTDQNRILSDAVFELKDLLIKLQSFTMEVNKILYEERVQFLSIMPQEEEEVRDNKMDMGMSIELSSVEKQEEIMKIIENQNEEVVVQEELK